MLERLEPLRNIKHSIKQMLQPELYLSVQDIVDMVNGTIYGSVQPAAKVSFIGFFNDFNNIIGKNCIYICFDEAELALAKQAVSHGALAILVDRKLEGLPCICVKDIYEAFLSLFESLYQKRLIPATVITGSIGKTTTKEMIACVYQEYFKTFCAPINGNTARYAAFEVQHIPTNTQQFIQEVDESYPHNASYCSRILHPRIAVVSNIDKSHIGALGGENQIAQAIISVTDFMPSDGYVIINADDPNSLSQKLRQNVVTVSIKTDNTVCYATNILLTADQSSFSLHYNQEIVPVTINCPGVHNVYNALMAFCAGKLSNVPTKLILQGLQRYRPMTIRQKTYRVNGKTLYVDCFNASARSIVGAIKVLDDMKPSRNGRRIAVLGDVGEIDGYEKETYSAIATAVSNSPLDILITYGSSSKQIWDYLYVVKSGIHIADESSLIMHLKKTIHRGDIVLFKASGFMKLDHVVKNLYPITFYRNKLPYYKKYASFIIKTL